jgi:DNA-binding SARP family transcriptional activator/tetratricopeptide (TPR) repeat protein
MIRLRTLGGLSLEGDSAPAVQRRPLALLAVLAAAGDLGVSRDKLLVYFWPESDEDRARNVLRQLLHTLRRDLALTDLFVGTTELRLNSALLTSDWAEFERACDAGDDAGAVTAYRGPFLDGFYLSNASGFESWKEAERARLARKFVDAAERVARAASLAGEHLRAIGMWQRLAVTEPLNSRIAIELMRAMAAAGDVGGALTHARIHETLLREELGAAPDSGFGDAVRQLLHPKRPGPAHSSDGAGRGPPIQLTPSTGSDHDVASSSVPALNVSSDVGRPARYRTGRFLLVIGALVAITTSVATLPGKKRSGSETTVDSESPAYLVVALAEAGAPAPRVSAARALYQELARWEGIRLVDWPDASEGVDRDATRNVTQAIGTARRLGVTRLIVERRWSESDDTVTGFAAFDVRSAKAYRTSMVRFERGQPRADDLRRVAREALVTESQAEVPEVGPVGTTVYAAWKAYISGQVALKSWSLAAARREFQVAVLLDPRFPEAHFWLARVSQWIEPRADDEGRKAAHRATELGSQLSASQHDAAAALAAMADGRFADACDRFRRLIAVDSLDFAGWFGLGDCQAYDSVVVADSRSPTGWRFRASYENAIASYQRALDLAPSFHMAFGGRALDRLRRLLFVDANRFRLGIAVGPGGRAIPMAAYATLGGDTIAFVPSTISDIQSGRSARTDSTRLLALQRNRVRLRDLMRSWLALNPRDQEAMEGYALSMEILGDVGSPTDSGAALSVIQHARQLTDAEGDRGRRLRLAIAAVRLALKSGAWRQAYVIADSLLAANQTASPETASDIAAIAALCGRVEQAATLLASSAVVERVTDVRGNQVVAPVPAVQEALRLLTYASFEVPADSIRTTYARLLIAIESYVEAARREAVRTALVRRPLRLTGTTLGALAASNAELELDPLVRLHTAVRGRDTAEVRSLLGTLAEQRINLSFRDIAVDQLLQESLSSLAIGDSVAAAAMLDKMLTTLPGQSTRLVSQVPTSAALMRAMLLRAELAHNAGDFATARRWATPVAELWRRADTNLARQVQPFHSLVDRRN